MKEKPEKVESSEDNKDKNNPTADQSESSTELEKELQQNQNKETINQEDNDNTKINLPENPNRNKDNDEDNEEDNNDEVHINPVISTCSNLKDTACMLRTFADDLDQLVDTVEPMIQLANKDSKPYSQRETRDNLKVSSNKSNKQENKSKQTKQENNLNLQSLISQSGGLDKSSLNGILMQVVMQSLLKQLMPNNE